MKSFEAEKASVNLPPESTLVTVVRIPALENIQAEIIAPHQGIITRIIQALLGSTRIASPVKIIMARPLGMMALAHQNLTAVLPETGHASTQALRIVLSRDLGLVTMPVHVNQGLGLENLGHVTMPVHAAIIHPVLGQINPILTVVNTAVPVTTDLLLPVAVENTSLTRTAAIGVVVIRKTMVHIRKKVATIRKVTVIKKRAVTGKNRLVAVTRKAVPSEKEAAADLAGMGKSTAKTLSR